MGYGIVGGDFGSLVCRGMGSGAFGNTFRVLLLAAVVVWLAGRRLNGDAEVENAPRHFMGFRLRYAAFIYMGLLAAHVLAGLAGL